MKYFGIHASNILHGNGEIGNSSIGIQLPSTHHEDKPLLNDIPLHEVSLDNQAKYKPSSDGKIAPRTNCNQGEITEFNQKIAIEQLQRGITRLEEYICCKEQEQKLHGKSKKEWKEIASIMDRCFFILYIIIIVTSLTLMFPRP